MSSSQLSNEEHYAYSETLKAFDLISNQMHKGATCALNGSKHDLNFF